MSLRHCCVHCQTGHQRQLPLFCRGPQVRHCAAQRGRWLQLRNGHLHLLHRRHLPLHPARVHVRVRTVRHRQERHNTSVAVSHYAAWQKQPNGQHQLCGASLRRRPGVGGRVGPREERCLCHSGQPHRLHGGSPGLTSVASGCCRLVDRSH